MELILISDSKLKVMLTSEDMKYYELDNERLDYDNTETRRAFRSILDEAKYKTGFDAEKDRIFIQVYPSRSGGCEMYVTKLGLSSSGESSISYQREEQKKTGNLKSCIYKFENSEFLLRACRALYQMGYMRESAAYCDRDKNEFYLIITEDVGVARSRKNMGEFCSILEFGTKVRGDFFHFYISEHCSAICQKNAVEKLSNI